MTPYQRPPPELPPRNVTGIVNINAIVKGIKYAIQLVKCKLYNCKTIVLGILPRDYSLGIRRNKTRLVNIRIKYAV